MLSQDTGVRAAQQRLCGVGTSLFTVPVLPAVPSPKALPDASLAVSPAPSELHRIHCPASHEKNTAAFWTLTLSPTSSETDEAARQIFILFSFILKSFLIFRAEKNGIYLLILKNTLQKHLDKNGKLGPANIMSEE